MIIDRIREDMTVISADDCCVGFVNDLKDDGTLKVTSVTGGYGHDHLIPLSWVSDVNKMVFLDKTSAYVTSNWRGVRFRGRAGSSDPPPLGSPATHLFRGKENGMRMKSADLRRP
jgi:hypothetical protein